MLARLPVAPLALSWRSIMHARGGTYLVSAGAHHMVGVVVVCTLHTQTQSHVGRDARWEHVRESTLQSNNRVSSLGVLVMFYS